MLTNHEALEYTVSSVVNKEEDLFMMSFNSLNARDSMYKMEYADLSKDQRLLNIDMFRNMYLDLENKISNQFFGTNETRESIFAKGQDLHEQILQYLNHKVIEEEDIDF